MKHIHKFLSLALALVLCLSLAACGSEDGRDDNDNNFYNAPNSLEGLVKDSEQMSNLYVFGGAWRGEGGETLISATSDAGDEVRFALYDADEEVTASGFIQFVPEYDYDYFYNEHDGVAYRGWFDEVGTLYVDSLGTFTKILGDAPGENVGDGDYGHLAGTWYQDAEPGAASILTFDASGSWELLERPGGDGDGRARLRIPLPVRRAHVARLLGGRDLEWRGRREGRKGVARPRARLRGRIAEPHQGLDPLTR